MLLPLLLLRGSCAASSVAACRSDSSSSAALSRLSSPVHQLIAAALAPALLSSAGMLPGRRVGGIELSHIPTLALFAVASRQLMAGLRGLRFGQIFGISASLLGHGAACDARGDVPSGPMGTGTSTLPDHHVGSQPAAAASCPNLPRPNVQVIPAAFSMGRAAAAATMEHGHENMPLNNDVRKPGASEAIVAKSRPNVLTESNEERSARLCHFDAVQKQSR